MGVKEINFATKSEFKMREFKILLEPGIKVNQISMEHPASRYVDDPIKIVEEAAPKLAAQFNKPIVVEESGFFIESLKGFPGIYTGQTARKLGNRGLLKLMEGKENRNAYFISAIAYCEPGGSPETFIGMERGTIASQERGSKGWGQDTIFIPEGQNKTYGEMRDEKSVNAFRRISVEKLKQFLRQKEE